MAALLHRERTGQGQRIEVSMLDSLITLMASEQFERLDQPGTLVRTGNYYDRFAPFGIYPAADGHVAICAPKDNWAKGVFEAIGRPELIDDPRFANRGQRMQNSATLNEIIIAWTERHPVDEIIQKFFTDRLIPTVRVRGPKEALKDANVRRRGAVVPLLDPHSGKEFATGVGMPIQFSESGTGFSTSVPSLGENNQEIFGGLLHIDKAKLEELMRAKVI
jgi:formyl-CoA transferase